jgi:archaellum component FlaF (FlaF/FlaG flagellin family)
MTYLFIAIGLSVVNGLAGKQVSYTELLFINFVVVAIVYFMDTKLFVNIENSKTIIYEKIENIKPENAQALKDDLENRTGLTINKINVGKVDFLKDVAEIKIFYNASEEADLLEND